jgi:hypothetical protein
MFHSYLKQLYVFACLLFPIPFNPIFSVLIEKRTAIAVLRLMRYRSFPWLSVNG